MDSDDVWEDKLLLVLGAVIAKDVFFFCRTLAMVAGVVSVCDEYNGILSGQ